MITTIHETDDKVPEISKSLWKLKNYSNWIVRLK